MAVKRWIHWQGHCSIVLRNLDASAPGKSPTGHLPELVELGDSSYVWLENPQGPCRIRQCPGTSTMRSTCQQRLLEAFPKDQCLQRAARKSLCWSPEKLGNTMGKPMGKCGDIWFHPLEILVLRDSRLKCDFVTGILWPQQPSVVTFETAKMGTPCPHLIVVWLKIWIIFGSQGDEGIWSEKTRLWSCFCY